LNTKLLALLKEDIALMVRAGDYVAYSYQRCREISHQSTYSPEELERFESLTGRFARLSDLLTQKIFRLIDRIDLDDKGTVRDRINRAEKKGLISSAEQFIKIRELRNSISHEYSEEVMSALFAAVLDLTDVLLDSIVRVKAYVERYEQPGLGAERS